MPETHCEYFLSLKLQGPSAVAMSAALQKNVKTVCVQCANTAKLDPGHMRVSRKFTAFVDSLYLTLRKTSAVC